VSHHGSADELYPPQGQVDVRGLGGAADLADEQQVILEVDGEAESSDRHLNVVVLRDWVQRRLERSVAVPQKRGQPVAVRRTPPAETTGEVQAASPVEIARGGLWDGVERAEQARLPDRIPPHPAPEQVGAVCLPAGACLPAGTSHGQVEPAVAIEVARCGRAG